MDTNAREWGQEFYMEQTKETKWKILTGLKDEQDLNCISALQVFL